MDAYLEIRLLPDPEFVPTVLLNALFTKVHHALVKLKANDIGISFPDYGKESLNIKPRCPLGRRLRLHGTHERLEQLMRMSWLTGMHDYVRVGSITPVPTHSNKYVSYRRVQVKSNVDRIRRRYMRRHNASYEDAVKRIPNEVRKTTELPFVMLTSQSTDQHFKLFIMRQELNEPVQGMFNTYGLSVGGAVPVPFF